MKLHQLFVVSSLFFQSFICLGMDDSSPEQLWQIIKTGNKNPFFCELGRQQIINNCRTQLTQKKLTKVDTKTSELKKEIVDLQTSNITLKIEGAMLLHTISEIEEETKDLQKKLAAIQESKTTGPVHIQTTPNRRKIIKRSPQHYDTTLTSREKLNGLKILKSQYHVREISVLLDKLREEADDAYKANNSYFDQENHFLRKKINAKCRFVFCPCTRKLVIVNHNAEVPLPEDFSCSDNCESYPSKKVSSSDSVVDTSTETESESDTQEEIPQEVFLSKEAIEKISD